jgi:Family of unknown function (DUF6338)
VPSTIDGLLLFLVFLVPGFLSYIQRRKRVDERRLSPLVELATFVTTSVVTTIVALGIFTLLRWVLPHHTPNSEQLFSGPHKYLLARPGYVVAWGLLLLAISSFLGFAIGRWGRAWITPIIVDMSAWNLLFTEQVPPDAKVFLGCDLEDGTYVSGYLAWFNTDPDEGEDRALVLATPITVRTGGTSAPSQFSRLILSAREIKRLHVSYLT